MVGSYDFDLFIHNQEITFQLLPYENTACPKDHPCAFNVSRSMGGVTTLCAFTGIVQSKCNTWMIIPLSKWLVTPIYKPFKPFGRGTTLLRVTYQPLTSWDDPPSTLHHLHPCRRSHTMSAVEEMLGLFQRYECFEQAPAVVRGDFCEGQNFGGE